MTSSGQVCPHCGKPPAPVSLLDRMRALGVSYQLACRAAEGWTLRVRYPAPHPARVYQGESLCKVTSRAIEDLEQFEQLSKRTDG